MDLPNDQQQDYLDDLPQVLLHRANISNVRNFLLSEPDAFHRINDNDANSADAALARVAKSEVDDVGDDSQDQLFKKEHFKFATQCPEITSQKAEKKSYHHGSGAKTLRRGREPPLNMPFPSKHLGYELKIIKQPEEQHRARYLTEGSRGTVKDKTGQGHPTVRLLGCDQPVVLQVFVGTDTGKAKPHGFYQACKVSHKNSSACIEKEIDGTAVIELPMDPKNDMVAVVDCVGILKLRNADVEQRIGLAKSKKKSTVARLVFRVNVPKSDSTYQTLQISSTPILCTQPTGAPEISKKSLNQCSARGGDEMFIIGKNFMKGTTVMFEVVRDDNKVVWSREAEIDQDFFQSTHLVCTVPSYQDLNIKNAVEAQIVVNSGGRASEPVPFFYTPCHHEIRKSPTDSITCLRDSNHFHMKNQQDPCFLKRSYALTSQEVPDEELPGVQFTLAEAILNDPSEKSHLSDAGLSIDGPHCLNGRSGGPNALLSSSIIIIPKEMSPQSTALIDNIGTGLLSSTFGDGSPGLTIPVPISNDESLKLEHDLLEAGEPQFKRAAHDDDEGIQAFIDMVTDKNDQENLADLSDQKTMMWSQDLDKTCVLSGQSIQKENLGYGFSPASQAAMTGGNSSDGLLLEFNSNFESESKDPMLASKSFITLSTVSNTSSLMDAFPEGVPFISDIGHQSEGSQGDRLFTLLSNESSCLDASVVDSVPRLGEMNSPEFLKLDDKMTVDESQSFGNDFLAQKTSADIGMGCNLQQSLSELKDLTSKVGISSIQNQEDKSRSSGFSDQEIGPHLINVDQKFIFQSSVPNSPQAMSTSNSFKGVVMESFPTLSSSYEMVSDPRSFEQQSPFGADKTIMTIQLINQQHQVDGAGDPLTGGFAMMEAHSDPQSLLMNHHPVQQTIELSSVVDPLILPHPNSADVSRVFCQASTDNQQQVFSEKSLDQEMVVQHHYEPGPSSHHHHHQQSSNPSESASEVAEQRELYYLFSDEISGNILTSQQNQISPLPNLTIEEVSQVLNMSGS